MEDIAILILNYNDYNMTKDCVNNLIDIGITKNILVVDNKSKNDSFKILKKELENFSGVTIIQSEKNGGYAYGNNYGINYIINKFDDIKYVAIMNPDIDINKIENISVLRDKLKNNKDIVAITGLSITNGKLSIKNSFWKLPSIKDLCIENISLLRNIKIKKSDNLTVSNDNLIYVDVLPGCYFLADIEKFNEIGLFDEETFLYFEENIIGKKIKQRNQKLAISIECFYNHNHQFKESKLENIKNKKQDYEIFMKSQNYYVEKYCERDKYKTILKITQYYHKLIEIPLICTIKKLKTKINK